LNKLHVAILFAASVCLTFAPAAFCTDLAGQVNGPNGPVAGCQVTVTNAAGQVVGSATTNGAGAYCITGLDPGSYKTVVTPPSGLQSGGTSSTIPPDGLTQDWSLSPATVASSSAISPGVCGPAWLAAGPVIGASALFVATGAGLGACAAAGCFSGSSHPSTSFH
jgi:hypothetical protein